MATIDGCSVEILNWEKYNPRKDITKLSWIRVDTTLPTSEGLFKFDAEERWIWLCFLCHAAKKNSKTFSLKIEYFADHYKLKKLKIESALKKAQENGLVKVTSQIRTDANGSVRTRTETCSTYERNEQDKTNDTNGTERDAATSGTSPDAPVIANLSDLLTKELLEKVKPEVQESWLQLYEDHEFVKRELQQAAVWCKANPLRKPKSDYGRFLTSWLARGWEKHRKTLPTFSPRPISAAPKNPPTPKNITCPNPKCGWIGVSEDFPDHDCKDVGSFFDDELTKQEGILNGRI